MDEPTYEGLREGSSFAGLTIVREIGRGGAGIVYLARDDSLDRLVALKILHRDSMGGDASAAERFRNEALIAAKLEHPSIIPVYASGTERGMTFLAMRYVPGRSLADAISDQGPLPIRDAVRLLRPIAAALDYAADHDIVHRDVKPANILVDESVTPHRALLSDFGIARAYEGTRHTATGGWVGTPDYIAPEILKDDTPTARSDQYSLACVLIEAISGNSPFRRSNTAATITAQLTESPDLALLPDVDSQTETALAIALEKNPDDRYATSVEFLDAVETSIGRDSNATPNTIVRKRKRNKITRRAKLAGGITLSLIAIAAAGADLLDIRNKLSSTPPPTPPAEAEAAAPQTDILILGDNLSTYDDTYIYAEGQTAGTTLIAALVTNERTAGATVKHLPLRRGSECGRELIDAIEQPPTTAIVILENPCGTIITKRLRAESGELPPIYNLALWENGESEFAAMTSPELFASWPNVQRRLSEEFGKAPLPKVFLMRPNWSTAGAFEAGVISEKLGLRACATFQESPLDDGSSLSQSIEKAFVAAGRGEEGRVRAFGFSLETLDQDAKEEERVEATIQQLRLEQIDCLVLPGITSGDQWAEKNLPEILRSLPEAYAFVPEWYIPRLRKMSRDLMERTYTIRTYAFLPDLQEDYYRQVLQSSYRQDTAVGTSNALLIYLATALIGYTQPGRSAGGTQAPEIPDGEWITQESGPGWSISSQDVEFDPLTGLTSSYGVRVSTLIDADASAEDPGVWLYIGGRQDPYDFPSALER